MSEGVLGRFETPAELVEAARRLRELGYRRLEAFTPFPVEELDPYLEPTGNQVKVGFFLGGLLGLVTAFGMQTYSTVVSYPLIVDGRPHFPWPAFLPVTFEVAVLFSAFMGLGAFFYSCGLPRLHHPLFESSLFRTATKDGFLLLLKQTDDLYERERTETHLLEAGAVEVQYV